MTETNRREEATRLQKLYGSKSNDELEGIASDPDALTDIARIVLEEELASRNLPPPSAFAQRLKEQELEQNALKPILIRRYRDLPEANIAKSILDSAGIESFLADENLVRLDWFYSNLVGGIKLLVHQRDVEAANKLLDEATPEKFDVEGLGEFVQPRCPQCQSMDVTLDGLDKRFTYGAMYLTSLPIPVTQKGWKCHSCGHHWTEDGEADPDSPQQSEGPQ